MPNKNDRTRAKLGRPPRPMPERIAATPDQIALAFFKMARKKAREWRYLSACSRSADR